MDLVKFADYEMNGLVQTVLGPDKKSLAIVLSLYNRDSGLLEIAETGLLKQSDLAAQKASLQAQISSIDAILAKFQI